MLHRHPAIAICRETDFHHLIYKRRQAFGNLSDLQNRQRLVKEYLGTERIGSMQLDLQALEQTLLREGTSYEAFFVSFLHFYAQAHGKRRFGEKTPQHALFTDTLCQWYPGATIIHLLRDPRDVVASLMRMPWASNSVRTNANTWLRCNLSAWRSRQSQGYLLVRYEDLVTQPEHELRRICASIGEEYSTAMLEPRRDPTADRPWFQRAQERVTTERLGRWREQLTTDEVALVEWFVSPHMQMFGYEPVGHSPSMLRIGRDRVTAVFDTVRQRLGEFPAAWYYLIRSANITKEEAARRRFRRRHLARPIDP